MIDELIKVIENYVELDESIKPTARFKKDLGLSSFDTVCMISEIKTVLGVDLQPSDFVKYKTVGEMADYISTLKA